MPMKLSIEHSVSFLHILLQCPTKCALIQMFLPQFFKESIGKVHSSNYSQNGRTDLDLSSSKMLFCFRHWTPFLFQNAILTFLLHIRGLHLGFALLGTMWLLAMMVELLCNGMWSHPCLNAAHGSACSLYS